MEAENPYTVAVTFVDASAVAAPTAEPTPEPIAEPIPVKKGVANVNS